MEVHSDNGEVKALDGVEGEGKSVLEDEAWESAEFVHEPPMLKITQPKGSFCQIDARFSVALPPDGVFNIITDPNNRRVFKNIKVRLKPWIQSRNSSDASCAALLCALICTSFCNFRTCLF